MPWHSQQAAEVSRKKSCTSLPTNRSRKTSKCRQYVWSSPCPSAWFSCSLSCISVSRAKLSIRHHIYILICCIVVLSSDHDALKSHRAHWIGYRILGLCCLFLWGWGIDVYLWTKYKVNYVFIFDFNPRRHHRYSSIFEVPLSLPCPLYIWVLIVIHRPPHCSACCWSSVSCCSSSRWHRLLHQASSGCARSLPSCTPSLRSSSFSSHSSCFSSRVSFGCCAVSSTSSLHRSPKWNLRTFSWPINSCHSHWSSTTSVILRATWCTMQADTRMVSSVSSVSMLYWHLWSATTCTVSNHWVLPLLALLPPFVSQLLVNLDSRLTCMSVQWRLMQCVRRYITDRSKMHIANGCKYSVAIIVATAAILRSLYSNHVSFLVIWIVIVAGNTTFTYIWDIKFDWSLGDKTATNKGLRNTLLYPTSWVSQLTALFRWLHSHTLFAVLFRPRR